jgi:uncharacterized membrane protein HdeD (DUF308 family)
MLHTLARNWWALALRGLVAVLFGLLTFILPGITLVTLVLLFGAYALVDGFFNVIAFFRVASHHWAFLIEGVIGIIAGTLPSGYCRAVASGPPWLCSTFVFVPV